MFIKSHKFNNKFSKLNIHRYYNTNNNSNNYLLNSQINNIYRQIEPNSLLTQRELSNTYISKVKFNRLEDNVVGDRIDISELAKSFDLDPVDVLRSLYVEGLSRTRYEQSNIFRLDPVRYLHKIVEEHPFTPSQLTRIVDDRFYQNTYHQTILQASLQKSHEDTGKRNNTLFGIPNRFYIPNKSRVILYDGPFYDCAKIEIDTRYDNKTKEHIIIISEHKIPTDHFDSEDLRTILSLADTNNGFIAGLGNVFLSNTFDNTHIYNMHNFDLKHGEGAFHTAMIKCIYNRTNTE